MEFLEAHHGSLTDQFRKTAANAKTVTSVRTEPPLLKSKPPTAGSKAKASGTECQCECSNCGSSPGPFAFGNSKSSVEEMIESEKVELRRCRKGVDVSAKVEARPKSLLRRGERLARGEFFAFVMLILLGGVIRALVSAIMSY